MKPHSYDVTFAAATIQVEAVSQDAAEEKARLHLRQDALCTGVVDNGESDPLGGDLETD